ncbi:unnamed protein product [Prunus armeniaca]|uniref:Uncharacterized protein n=2 Tax=Prunus armeniaca TaxID=36596 RepID=A0A6J5WHW8_PRUAR|nr:unnamed protein product [Prunus armeniaca]
MGMTMSFMELGGWKPSAEMFTFAMGKVVYNQFIEKYIIDFEIFHIAIVDIIKLYSNNGKKPKRKTGRDLLIEFLKKIVKVSKVDDTTTVITGLLTPPMAMAAKITVEIALQLKMVEAIPDVLFIPSAAVLVLIYASNSIRNRDGATISDVLFAISVMLALIYAKISNMMTYSWIFQHHPRTSFNNSFTQT